MMRVSDVQASKINVQSRSLTVRQVDVQWEDASGSRTSPTMTAFVGCEVYRAGQ